ncbi:MAG: hypothetical protein EXR71_17255 [Myxococcales bacterium]|nr:hypothetical protein [Myxococcales bacterium]
MNVCLRGSSPATMVAGILLLSRARTFGQRIRVDIVGDPTDVGAVTGPAVLYSAPLASCGVGRDFGSGALVVVPGPTTAPLAVSFSPDGRGGWFEVAREGDGEHPASRALMALLHDPDPERLPLARAVRSGFATLGVALEPSVLDVLFGAPAAPLVRLAVALRAGRTLTGERGAPMTAALVGPLGEDDATSAAATLARLHPRVRAPMADLRRVAKTLSAGGSPALLLAMDELLAHFGLLPLGGILPPLDPATDAVAVGLGRALAATAGEGQAQVPLMETYRFLGGGFVTRSEWVVDLPADAPPTERLARWRWFCTQVSEAAARVDRIWRDLVDPPM